MKVEEIKYDVDAFRYQKKITGNSEAISIRGRTGNPTIVISGIKNGTVEVYYSLSSVNDVSAGKGIWILSNDGVISKDKGIPIGTSVSFLKAKGSTPTTTYVFQVLV